MRTPPEHFPSTQAVADDRAGQVAHVLLIGLAVVAGLVAFVVLAHLLGVAFGWMVAKRWPVILYAVASVGVIVGGYIGESPAMYYGIGALFLPVLLMMFLALIGF